jgi:TetR/AcrR family transcriptional repressor of nem operon
MARPREYDEDEVLSAAVEVFWSKGYDGTSTRDLSACTGLTSSSMYAAYGDKRKLFHRALDHYLNRTLRAKIAKLEGTPSPSGAIRQYFSDVIEKSVRDTEQRGCMLVNSALEASPSDTKVRDAIAEELSTIEAFFRRRLSDATRAGEIPPEVSAELSARHLLTVLLGIRVLARVRAERELLTGGVRQALLSMGIAF